MSDESYKGMRPNTTKHRGEELAYRQGVIDGKTEGFDVGYQQGYDQGYRVGDTDAAVISFNHEAIELLIADIVQKAHPYGVQDGDFIASYMLPTGPIHRAIKYLNEHGISTIAEPNPGGFNGL